MVRQFTVTLDEEQIALFERCADLGVTSGTLEQYLQYLVDNTMRLMAVGLANPHFFDGLSLEDFGKSQYERMQEKLT